MIPQAIHLRDAVASAASESAVRASFLAHQLRATIAGKMTPVLQVTDTDLAAPMKRAAESVKEEIVRRKRDEAIEDGEEHSRAYLKCTPAEILEVVSKSVAAIRSLDERQSVVLRGMRRNGWLHMKLEPATGRLRLAREVMDSQWLSDHPETSHRIPDSWWRLRTLVMSEVGRLEPPNWGNCGDHAECFEDTMDLFPEQGPDEPHGLKVLAGKEVESLGVELEMVVEEGDPLLAEVLEAVRPKLPKAVSASELEGVNSETLKAAKQKYRAKRRKMRAEVRRLRRLADMHGEYSRAQLLSALVPEAKGGEQKKRKKAERGSEES